MSRDIPEAGLLGVVVLISQNEAISVLSSEFLNFFSISMEQDTYILICIFIYIVKEMKNKK